MMVVDAGTVAEAETGWLGVEWCVSERKVEGVEAGVERWVLEVVRWKAGKR